MDSNNYNNNNNNNKEWINNLSSQPPSFIQQLPENVKLLLATIFIAIIIHIFITIRQRQRNINDGIDRLRDDISGRGAVGSCSVTDTTIISGSSSVAANEKDGQVLGNIQSSDDTEEKPKRRINNVANRNYDALINKIEPNEEEDDEQEEVGEFGGICRGKKKKNSKQKSTSEEQELAVDDSPRQPEPEPPQIELKSQANHPGLTGYYNWHSTITSLYRIYAVPFYETNNTSNNATYHKAILPMHPSSERGSLPIYIEVINHTSHPLIDVYWIDHKGNEVHKGSINKGGRWQQTTFIGHPWTFRVGSHEGEVLIKYVPFRVIPSISGAPTTTSDNNEGMQNFILRDVPADHVLQTSEGGRVFKPVCWVEDSILPEPPLKLQNSNNNSFTNKQMTAAIQWSCQQLQREDAIYHGNGIASAKRTLQYLKNICLHPDEPKYRKLRIGNKIFQQTIYNTGARGILLALGFEELYGYLECGPGGGKCLGLERIQQILDAMMIVNHTLKIMQDESNLDIIQPQGGDGYGRAGFGYAGGMNI